jgi:hypothetical protein
MKYCLIVLATGCLLGGYVFAADMSGDNVSIINDTWTVNQGHTMNSMKDYVEDVGGKMMVVTNGMETMMESDMTMSNGTVVMKDGTYKTKGGSMMKLKNGDKMDMDGNITIGK